MQPIVKQTVAIVAVALIAIFLYYGTYLPYAKSVSYITALGEAHNATSLEDFMIAFSTSLDQPSPVGQEELTRNVLGSFTGIVTQYGGEHPEIVAAIMPVAEQYYQQIAASPSALSFVQTMSVIGNVYDAAYTSTGNIEYGKKAEEYYLRGLEMSPNRPQFLYPLVNLYFNMNEQEKAKTYAERIVELWPDDTRVADVLKTL